MPTKRCARLFFWLLLSLPFGAGAQGSKVVSYEDIHHPVFGKHGIVATQEAIATRIGLEVLKRGGNAIDAAVAVGFTLAVTLPRAGNLGGGGFMLVHSAESGETVAIDYRETAPEAAYREMYLAPDGSVDTAKSRDSYRSAGVPGTVAGLLMALEHFGTMSRQDVIAPAIQLAHSGFVVRQDLADSLAWNAERLARWPQTRAIFLDRDNRAPAVGERLVQSDLAWTLGQVAKHGSAGFYEGEVAAKIVDDMTANDGLIGRSDLAGYRAILRRPVNGTYRGYEIRSMPPPSSGGVHLVQILNILEDFPIGFLGANSADTIHLMTESMKLAYADRSQHLGDPDFWPVPVRGLISKRYAQSLRREIDLNRATPSDEIAPGQPQSFESSETTHYSIMDRFGNAVSNTYTINFGYGSGIVASGTGVLLNNEMDDFSAKPGVPNAYGLLGGDANAIEPGKRPLSSMTPTLVLKDGVPFLATGSPGGSRIITTTLQIIMNVIDHQMSVAMASAAPRIHHQWFPDEIRIERGISPDTIDILTRRGHQVVVKSAMGSTQTTMRTEDGFYGASDPRTPGALTLGY